MNLAEGIDTHHLLQIHQVKQGDPNEWLYNLTFLDSGLILVTIGWGMKGNTEDKRQVYENS